MNDKNINLVKALLSSLPSHSKDQHLDLVYRHGYLIGLLGQLLGTNSDVRREIEKRIKNLKSQ